MRTLHFSLCVADLDRSLAFYTAVGYQVVGSVPDTELGELTMLKLPGDESVTIELVHDSRKDARATHGAPSHFVLQVGSIDATMHALSTRGIAVEVPTSPNGSTDFLTTWIVDPEGNRIELVQWPTGHADGMSSADFKTPELT